MKLTSSSTDSGIHHVGPLAWGSHLCHVYDDPEELLHHVLVPYFRTGLVQGESCVWVLGEGFAAEEALAALRKSLHNCDDYLKSQQLEILSYHAMYLPDGQFDAETVLRTWGSRAAAAVTGGFRGLRVTGDPFWLHTPEDWDEFIDYEDLVNQSLDGLPVLALCTYPLRRCGAREILDIARTHESALIKRRGAYELLWYAKLAQTKEALREAQDELRRQRHVGEELQRAKEELESLYAKLKTSREELIERVQELEQFHGATVDRELRMMEMEKENEQLKKTVQAVQKLAPPA